jgi:hypothetical protein
VNIDLALTLIIQLLNRSSEISALIAKARGEGRDITDAELDVLQAADDAARADLMAAIAARRAAGG